LAESGGSSAGFGTRYPYYYGPEGRLVLVDSALEAVNRGSTTIGIKTPILHPISDVSSSKILQIDVMLHFPDHMLLLKIPCLGNSLVLSLVTFWSYEKVKNGSISFGI
jgi:hypothetical protein